MTLGEYVSRMPEEQKYIYYASGDSVEAVDHLPQTELLKDRSMEILYFTDKTDEFIPDIFRTYGDKAFRSAVDGDLELGDEKQPETADHQETLDFLKETLGSRVDQVKASGKLKSHPVCLTSGEGMTFEMEKYFAARPRPEGQAYSGGERGASRLCRSGVRPHHGPRPGQKVCRDPAESGHAHCRSAAGEPLRLYGFGLLPVEVIHKIPKGRRLSDRRPFYLVLSGSARV